MLPYHPSNMWPELGSAVAESFVPILYHLVLAPLTFPPPSVSMFTLTSLFQFQVSEEALFITKFTLGFPGKNQMPDLGAEPVPVQPVTFRRNPGGSTMGLGTVASTFVPGSKLVKPATGLGLPNSLNTSKGIPAISSTLRYWMSNLCWYQLKKPTLPESTPVISIGP